MNPRTATTAFGVVSLFLVSLSRFAVLPTPSALPLPSVPAVGYIEGLNGLMFAYTKALLDPQSGGSDCEGCFLATTDQTMSNANGSVTVTSSNSLPGVCFFNGTECEYSPCHGTFTYSWHLFGSSTATTCYSFDGGPFGCKPPKSVSGDGSKSTMVDVGCGHTVSSSFTVSAGLTATGTISCSSCLQYSFTAEENPKSSPEPYGSPNVLADLSLWSSASETAERFFRRDRDAIRGAFLQASKNIVSGEGLQEAFTFEDSGTASDLANVVQAEAASLLRVTEKLADAYVFHLHKALEDKRHSMPPEVLDPNSIGAGKEILGMVMDIGGKTLIYRVMLSDDPVLSKVIFRRERVNAELQALVADTVKSATGGVVRRRLPPEQDHR